MDVEGARCLVVGGGRRLGRELALDLARHGAVVAVSSRRRDEALDGVLAELRAATGAATRGVAGAGTARTADAGAAHSAAAGEAGGAHVAVVGDAGTADGAAALVSAAAEALGGLDVLLYAASGPFEPTRPEQIDEASWDVSLDTIAKGFFFTACAAKQSFAGPGVVVAITDLLGLQPFAAFAAHGAAKAAEIHLVKQLARAWAHEAVRVCGIAPGPVDLTDDDRRDATLRAAERLDGRRLVLPGEVGAGVRFCIENEAVTGVNIPVDGGSLVIG